MLAHGVVMGFEEAPFASFDLRPQVVFEDAADSLQRGIDGNLLTKLNESGRTHPSAGPKNGAAGFD